MFNYREFEKLLSDTTKEIVGDIRWTPIDGREPAQGFTVAVRSEAGWPLEIVGWWNPGRGKLSYALIHEEGKRIVGVCLGAGVVHHRPTCRRTRAGKRHCDCPRGTHMHRWTEQFGDQWIDAPHSITADAEDPSAVWQQFCAEINLAHRGILR